MSEEDSGTPASGAVQRQRLPSGWRTFDAALVRVTEILAFVVGITFALLVTLEVISRYIFDFSIALVNSAARMLLIWFFLLGAGLALRRGAHIGFELLRRSVSGRLRRATVLTGHVFSFAFFALMLWSGMAAFGPSLRQIESGLGVSLAWGVAAVPVGFALLIYHLLVIAWTDRQGDESP